MTTATLADLANLSTALTLQIQDKQNYKFGTTNPVAPTSYPPAPGTVIGQPGWYYFNTATGKRFEFRGVLYSGGAWYEIKEGGGLTWEYKNSNFTIESGKGYIVDTTSAIITATLPLSLTTTFATGFKDFAGTFGTNKLLVARAVGATYNLVGQTAEPLEIDYNYAYVELAFANNNVSI